MPSFSTIAASFIGLAATVAALPTQPSELSARTPWTDCSAGTVFYRCANGYVGCFTTDPCALPPKTYVDIPAPTSTKASCPTGTTRAFEPVLYNLLPGSPDQIGSPQNTIHLELKDNKQIVQQVAVWKGIPAEAKTCVLGWAQAPVDQRHFEVGTTGFTLAQQLTSLPSHGFSFNNVESIIKNTVKVERASPDFTFWDEDLGGRQHVAGDFPCSETMAFRFQMQNVNGPNGDVMLQQDFQNGWTISYTC